MNVDINHELQLISNALKALGNAGIIRSKNLVGDLGEYFCKEHLDIKLNINKVNAGFDARDNKGNKVEIKTRRLPENKSKVTFKSLSFDYCLFVELNEYFEPIQIIKIPVEDIKANLEQKKQRLSVGKLKKIQSATIVFPKA